MVNETKITLRNTFIGNHFALEMRKNKKMTKGPSFRNGQGLLTCLLALRPQMPHVCGFEESFSLSCTAKLAGFLKKFQKILLLLRVNESKVTLTNAFIGNIFALKSEKESKNDERTTFCNTPGMLHLSVTP